MPFKSKEDKAAWRRANREKNRIYKERWLQKKLQSNPHFLAGLLVPKIIRQCAKCGSEFESTVRGKRIYCGPECAKSRPSLTPCLCVDCGVELASRRRRCEKCRISRKRDVTKVWKSATWQGAASRALYALRMERDRVELPVVKAMAHSVARVIRLMQDRPHREQRTPKTLLCMSWDESAARMAQRVSSSRSGGSLSVRRKWASKAHRIANGMRTRKGHHEEGSSSTE